MSRPRSCDHGRVPAARTRSGAGRGRTALLGVLALLLLAGLGAGAALLGRPLADHQRRPDGTDLPTASTAVPPPPPPADVQWRAYYSTRFRDLAGWTPMRETQGNDNSVNLPDNVLPASFGDGTGLTLRGRREAGYPRPYTSGEIVGRDSRTKVPNYFRAEVTGTVPDAAGVWPCLLWFRPANHPDGEIDVMEYFGGLYAGDDRRVAVTMHNEYGPTHRSVQRQVYWSQLPRSRITAMHRYTIEKTPGRVRVWVDDDTAHAVNFYPDDAAWWDRIMENPRRTWWPRITLQVGEGAVTRAVGEPEPGWQESRMTVRSLRLWVPA